MLVWMVTEVQLKCYGVYIYWNRCFPLISQYSVIRGQCSERSGSERSRCSSSDYTGRNIKCYPLALLYGSQRLRFCREFLISSASFDSRLQSPRATWPLKPSSGNEASLDERSTSELRKLYPLQIPPKDCQGSLQHPLHELYSQGQKRLSARHRLGNCPLTEALQLFDAFFGTVLVLSELQKSDSDFWNKV